jgi:hypothetical protein
MVDGLQRRLTQAMPGASRQTRRVKNLNVNWIAGRDSEDGRFEVMLVTEDGQHHVIAPSATTLIALVALSEAGTVLAWDPTNATLIAANVVGTMPWTQRSSTDATRDR